MTHNCHQEANADEEAGLATVMWTDALILQMAWSRSSRLCAASGVTRRVPTYFALNRKRPASFRGVTGACRVGPLGPDEVVTPLSQSTYHSCTA